MAKLTLLTSAEAYAALTAEAHRNSKRPAKVDRDALRSLIIDHGRALSRLRGEYIDGDSNAGN